jgi:glyoxylase-like metal-dependent hydrolase (beta-lactamase superfamily II)
MSSSTDEDLIVPKKWYEALPRKSWERFKKIETGYPWFEVYEVTPNTYAIYEPGQFQEVISYLALGEERAALIDTGYGMGDMRGLVELLTDLPVTVVITHTHIDHIGHNTAFDDVAVFDHQFARDNASQGRDYDRLSGALGEGMVWMPYAEEFIPESFSIPAFEVHRWLKDGDVVNLGERSLEIRHIPGHSPDSICLLDRSNRLLWTGDMFYNAPLYVYSDTSDLDEFIESYQKMVDLSEHYDWLMPSHNETYVDKEVISRVLKASKDIKAGRGGKYREQNRRGTLIHRYDYEGFAIIVKAPSP